MIRNSYSQPQDDAPYTPAYDMDIDIPLPDSEPDNAAIVSPDELLQDPPELAEPAAETENPSEPSVLLRQHRRFRHVPTRSPASTFCRTVSAVPATLR